MNIAKVVVNDQTFLDLTSDTVEVDALHENFTALDSSGSLISGTVPLVNKESELISGTLTSYTNLEVTQLTNYAFIYQPNMSTISLGELTVIPTYAFYGCSSLSSISNISQVSSLGTYAFYNCSSLSSLNVGELSSIPAYCFYGCTNLTSVSSLSKVTSLGDYAFANCSSLTSLYMPKVTSIGPYSLQNSGITQITDETFPSLGQTLMCGIVLRANQLTDIELSGEKMSLYNGSGAFRYCSNLVTAKFPNASKNVGASYVGIGSFAFGDCTSLELVDIGWSKSIGANNFYNAPKLRTMIIRKSDSITTLSNWAAANIGGIYNNPTLSTIYVPEALIESYQTATNWSTGYAAGLTFAKIEGSIYEI